MKHLFSSRWARPFYFSFLIAAALPQWVSAQSSKGSVRDFFVGSSEVSQAFTAMITITIIGPFVGTGTTDTNFADGRDAGRIAGQIYHEIQTYLATTQSSSNATQEPPLSPLLENSIKKTRFALQKHDFPNATTLSNKEILTIISQSIAATLGGGNPEASM